VATTCTERGWRKTDYQNKHYNINQKDEGTQEDRGRDGGTNFILRIKEKETRLTLQEHDDDDDNLIQFVCISWTNKELDIINAWCNHE
jgi:Rieske Fe-S protein